MTKKKQQPDQAKAKKKNIYSARQQKKRRRLLRRCAAFLLLVMAVLVLYQRRDSWMPQLETMGLRHSANQQDQDSNGKFPLYVPGGTDYQIGAADGDLTVLTDSYLHFYRTSGSMDAARQHTYGNAMLQTSGSYALVYESGGTHFRLDTPNKAIYEKSVPESIIFGRISSEGKVILVTGAQTCACNLYVFNAKGQQIYKRECVEDLCDVCFHPDGKGCYAASIYVDAGVTKSVVYSYSFTAEDCLWHSQALDMLAVSVYNTGEGNVFVLGDTRCIFLDSEGIVRSSYTYPDSLRDCTVRNEKAVLLLSNQEKRTHSVVILNGSANTPIVRSYDREIKDIGLLSDGNTLVQLRSGMEKLSETGNLLQEIEVSDSYDGFLCIGSYLFLHGYQHIDRIENRG